MMNNESILAMINQADVPLHENLLLRSVLDCMPEFVYIKDREGRYLVDNLAHRSFHGVESLEEIIGKTVYDLFPDDAARDFSADDQQVMESGKSLLRPERVVTHRTGNLEFWLTSSKMPLRTPDGEIWGMLGIGRDDTARVEAEMALKQQQHLLKVLMDTVPDHIYFKDRESRFIRVNRSMAQWMGAKSPDEAAGRSDFDVFSHEHAQQAFEDEQRLIQSAVPLLDKEEKETWPDGRVTWVSSSKLPLRDPDGNVVGTFGISRDITERKEAQMRIARYAYETKEMNARMEADLSLASELQRAFLPSKYPSFPSVALPEESRIHFTHHYQPTGKVGGDFFTVLPLSDTQAGVFFCDVMGHGIRAALVTAMLRTLISDLAHEALHPGPFLTAVNARLRNMVQLDWETLFATACYLVIDVEASEVQVANAGHPSPFLIHHESGRVSLINEDPSTVGPAMGLNDTHEFTCITVPIQANDEIFLYTDGVYEVEGEGGEYFDEDRLLDRVAAHSLEPAETLFQAVLREIKAFSRTDSFDDDVCMFAAQFRDTGN